MVPSNDWPITAPTPAATVTLVKPCTLEAVPAICPIFSIAIAEKLALARPKQPMVIAWRTANTHRFSNPASASARCSADAAISSSTAPCASRRVPTRITSRALARLAAAIVPAVVAKMTSSSRGRPNVSAMICWIELR